MRKLFGFIIGLATILMVFAMIYIVGAIYDSSTKIVVEPYFFRTGLTAANQTGVPRTVSEIGERRLRDWLIQKFVTEYFYVVPDVENVALRTRGRTANIHFMASSTVEKKWANTVVPEIRELAANGAMRKVHVFNEIFKPANSDYWHVDYELKTWYNPNDMNERPQVTHGTMHIKIENVDAIGGLKTDLDQVQKALIAGIDPAVVFIFRVTDVLDERDK